MPFTFLSCEDFLRNNLKNYLYTSTQVRLMYHVLDMHAIGPPTSLSTRSASIMERFKILAVTLICTEPVRFYGYLATLVSLLS